MPRIFPSHANRCWKAWGRFHKYDAQAKEMGLSPEARLQFHQEHSREIMDQLRDWINQCLEQKLVEPNSGLGDAFQYMLRHWDPLTLFLRQAGAPLDNNICYAARGIIDIMPTPGLCRVAA